MFNPIITKKDSPYETEEGCLSLAGVRKTIRYRNIELEFTDLSWKHQRQKYSGFIAQIIQHECDHLEGIISAIDERSKECRISHREHFPHPYQAGKAS